MVLDHQTPDWFVEYVAYDRFRHSQNERPAWMGHAQHRAVQGELAEGLLQVVHLRRSQKGLDLDGDAPTALLRPQELLGPEIDVQVLASPGHPQRVIGND